MLSISYAICTHNEGYYIQNLLDKLVKNIAQEDEIVIVDDNSTDDITLEILEAYKDKATIYKHSLDGNFSEHKNFLKSKCTKDYVFQIDADELPHDNLLLCLKEILLMNPEIDMMSVPRINIVTGITTEHLQKWGWIVNEKGYINYPDPQNRIFKNIPEISWKNKVHEVLIGHKTHSLLPYETDDYSIIHLKDIRKQEAGIKLYQEINPELRC